MHVLIGGGSGFIGSALGQALRQRGDEVTLVSRIPGENRITWDTVKAGRIPPCDAVVNLAGKHILDMSRRWTPQYRDEVIVSLDANEDIRAGAVYEMFTSLNMMEKFWKSIHLKDR